MSCTLALVPYIDAILFCCNSVDTAIPVLSELSWLGVANCFV